VENSELERFGYGAMQGERGEGERLGWAVGEGLGMLRSGETAALNAGDVCVNTPREGIWGGEQKSAWMLEIR